MPNPDLLRAADYIEENGWYRGQYFGPNDEACLLGAIGRAIFPGISTGNLESPRYWASKEFHEARKCLINYLELDDVFSTGAVLSRWNDHEDRTQDQVIDALRSAGNTCD